jgi:hypothetical protein
MERLSWVGFVDSRFYAPLARAPGDAARAHGYVRRDYASRAVMASFHGFGADQWKPWDSRTFSAPLPSRWSCWRTLQPGFGLLFTLGAWFRISGRPRCSHVGDEPQQRGMIFHTDNLLVVHLRCSHSRTPRLRWRSTREGARTSSTGASAAVPDLAAPCSSTCWPAVKLAAARLAARRNSTQLHAFDALRKSQSVRCTRPAWLVQYAWPFR